ncbi:cobyrinate a,c-diamide synthase [Acidipropionibacterium virtanenii]|uniref:cobyrinate a,c-diamide synthase n=1 Tax=Acidipropionibacterium virtanenii TaxID=2057246 RepID=UPI000DEC56C4|nr:cobyrinate a,c-diamide synthase [Acidipropionibacterium virtanenii]
MRIPRVLIAAPASGGGKTTVATGLMAALRAAGREVAPFKVGPDYIDPGYHGLATGRPGRNLDSVMCGADLMAPLLAHGFATPEPADVAVIEGVMGLFDGRLGDGAGSSAQIAKLTGTPVVLVVDTSHASLTHAAVVAGLAGFDPDVRIAGVILNQIGSARHGAEIRRGVEGLGIPVLGEIPRDKEIAVPSRHLGLVPAAERDASTAQVQALAGLIAEHVDLDAVMEVAASAPDLDAIPWDPAQALRASAGWDALASARGVASPLIGIASGRAFTFRYAETTELLEAAGCRVVDVDPLTDTALPEDICGLYLGGGFPEMHADELSANRSLHESIRAHVAGGMPVVAECAGLLMLCRTLDGHPMTGVLPLDAAMRRRLTMGYRDATAPADTLLAGAGERVIGHEFHRTGVTNLCDDPQPAWAFTTPDGSIREEGASMDPAGLGRPTVHASYLHLHWAGAPACAAKFAAEAWAYAARSTAGAIPLRSSRLATIPDGSGSASGPGPQAPAPEPDLHHHGDHDVAPGLVDLAVNVRVDHTPDWLVDAITASAPSWQAYPDPAPARAALARHHDVDPAMLLPTNGGAEAFVLVARAFHPRHAVVVHPQFTEPEAALRTAGHDVDRLILGPGNGFALNPASVPRDADLVVIGNPTNPTGALHPAAALRELARPGRILVVDEAFMDATDGVQTLIGPRMEGVLVLRSLTKTYGLAGIRAGYAVGDRRLIARLAAQQQAWSVSTPAIAAMIACCGEEAERHRSRLAAGLPAMRDDLTARLRTLGLRVIESGAPFVLVDTSSIGQESVRESLACMGFAVRRGETFPGLGPTWIRLAVRDSDTHARLADALAVLNSGPINSGSINTKENR